MIFVLAGNQNSGKTTLFNRLTGSNQHVGNFPGVTVEKKTGKIGSLNNSYIVDLPGIYSIRTYSAEERVTRDFLINEKFDGIINIVDASNIERNLYLTLQLIELGIPVIIALNMMDEVRNNGTIINISTLENALGVPVIPISAARDEGIGELVKQIAALGENRLIPTARNYSNDSVKSCVRSIEAIIGKNAEQAMINTRFSAFKVIEGDDYIRDRLALNPNQKKQIEQNINHMENKCGLDRHAALADMRYRFIESICKTAVNKNKANNKEHIRSLKIDSILTNRFVALPLFLFIMFSVFWLTFDVIGGFLSGLFACGIGAVTEAAESLLLHNGINNVIVSLIIDGILTGVGSVLKFLPVILTLFFFLSLMEDSGYMARVAFIMDKPLRRIGLSGRSFVPMLLGFGCSVPAVMATRTLTSARDRKLTILLIPFVSCTAKIPIYAVFTAAFFKERQGLIMILLYLLGVTTGVICAAVLNKAKVAGDYVPFVLELPNYRLPSAKTTLLLMWEKAKDFITRTFTVIFLASIIIWFLQSFDLNLSLAENGEDSLLAILGKALSPLFTPLGFSDPRISAALITGLSAKEAVISTLSVLTGADILNDPQPLYSLFTVQSAFSFLVFTLLYPPCFAAISVMHRELGSKVQTAIVFLSQCIIAWVSAYLIGRPALFALVIVAICIFLNFSQPSCDRNKKYATSLIKHIHSD